MEKSKAKEVLIFGIGDFARLLYRYFSLYSDRDVAAFTADSEYIQGEELMGKPIVDFDNVESSYPAHSVEFIVAVGYSAMNNNRREAFERIAKKGYGFTNYIHPTATLLTHRDNIGSGNIIFENVNLGMDTAMGDGNIIWNGCNIGHNSTLGSFNFLSGGTAFGGNVTVGDCCFFGLGSIVRNDVSIESETLAGAGVYLNESTRARSVYVPAKAIEIDKKSTELNI